MILFWYTSMCIYLVLMHQNKYLYKSTNLVFNFIELHMAIVFDWKKNSVLNLGIVVLEMIWLQIAQHHIRHLYCIGKGMTLEELRRPYLYV